MFSELPEEQQQRWEAFVSGPLAETNKKNTVDLVRLDLLPHGPPPLDVLMPLLL